MEASRIDALRSDSSRRLMRSSTWDTRQGITAQAASADAIERIAASELMFKSILRYFRWFRVFGEKYPTVVFFPEDIANVFTDGINSVLRKVGFNNMAGFVDEYLKLTLCPETWINLDERRVFVVMCLPPGPFLPELPIYDFRAWFLLRHLFQIV